MTQNTHTKGPWTANGLTVIESDHDGVNRSIAELISWERDSLTHEEKANARLLAAAPDLLETLELFEQLKDDLTPEQWARHCVLFEQKDRVLAKVRG